jgi:hypothetical protein
MTRATAASAVESVANAPATGIDPATSAKLDGADVAPISEPPAATEVAIGSLPPGGTSEQEAHTGTAGIREPVRPPPPAVAARVTTPPAPRAEQPRPQEAAVEQVAERGVPTATFDQLGSTRFGSPQTDLLPEVAPARAPERAPVVAAPALPQVQEEAGVRSALMKYQTAYRELDATAAKRVWPSVDEKALARAFAGLESQLVVFDNCTISMEGSRARAACSGHSRYVGRVGSRNSQLQNRDWTFLLKKTGEDWQIDSVRTR